MLFENGEWHNTGCKEGGVESIHNEVWFTVALFGVSASQRAIRVAVLDVDYELIHRRCLRNRCFALEWDAADPR